MKKVTALILMLALVFSLNTTALAAEKDLAQLVYEHNEQLLSARADHPVMPEMELSQAVIDKSNEIVGNETDDEKKLRLIFDWVYDNIVYDQSTSVEDQKPEIVLVNRRAVCEGYSRLSQALALAQGIPCYLVGGSTGIWSHLAGVKGWKTVEDIPRGYGSHAWNEAFVNGRWITFDSTNNRFDLSLKALSAWHLMRLTYTNTYTYSVTQVQTDKGRFLFDKQTGTLTDYEGEDTVLTIPSVVEGVPVVKIGRNAFYGSTVLERVVLPDSITYLNGGFSGCTALKEVVFPNGITEISGVFSGCTALERITIPDGVTDISGAFKGCTALEHVVIPNSVTCIGDSAFEGCTALTAIDLPDTTTVIEKSAFEGCTALKEIILPDGIAEIKESSFEGCTALTEVHIPSSIKAIGKRAFRACSGLAAVTFSGGVTGIGGNAFSGCTALKSIVLPDGVTEIEGGAFSGCEGLTAVSIPDSVATMGNGVFSGCTSLTEIEIPNGITVIKQSMFDGCSALERIILPDGVTEIGSRAFGFCGALTDLTLPGSVTKLGSWVFLGCGKLTDIYFGGTEAQWNAIEGISNNKQPIQATVHYNSTQPEPPANEDRIVSTWAKGEVDKAEGLGLIPDSLKTADLTQDITRAEFAAVAVKLYEAMSGKAAVPAENNPFTDTADPDVLLAYGTGLINGMSATTFQPDTLLSREQAATLLTRVYKKVTMPGWTLTTDGQFPVTYTKPAPFEDDSLISNYARDSVYFMAANNIVGGIGGNKFAPRNTTEAETASGYANATREAAVILAVRMVEKLGS